MSATLPPSSVFRRPDVTYHANLDDIPHKVAGADIVFVNRGGKEYETTVDNLLVHPGPGDSVIANIGGVDYKYDTQKLKARVFAQFPSSTTKSVATPTLVSPSAGSQVVGGQVLFRLTPFIGFGGAIHQSTSWQVALAADTNFLNPVAPTAGAPPTTATSWSVLLPAGHDYIARACYLADGVQSAWSPVLHFKV